MASSPPSQALSHFATTRWTLVIRSRGESDQARTALAELCQAYWQPVFRFLVREGRTEDQSRELTQDFFAQVLAGQGFSGADPARGRFRSYLLGALKHYLAAQRQREQRLKRGGGQALQSLDVSNGADEADLRDVVAEVASVPDTWFDRQWALAVMDGALRALQHEFISEGKQREFEILKPWLGGEAMEMTQAEAASVLGVSEGAVKVTVHRLRKRFRELVRKELAETVPADSEIDDELRYLVEVLAQA